jgi:type III restriction enzyme
MGSAQIRNYISLRKAKPLVVDNQRYLVPQKSVFNKIIGDSQFELEFAAFLENCPDIVSFAKNYQSLGFKIEYQGEDGNIHEFFPDFLIKKTESEIFIAETKGREIWMTYVKSSACRFGVKTSTTRRMNFDIFRCT